MEKNSKIRYIGNRKSVEDVSLAYFNLSVEDEMTADLLLQQNKYRHACYLFVQAMEKYVRFYIYKKVNPNLKYFAEKSRNHNLDKLLEFLIEINFCDPKIREHIKEQLDTFVLGGIRFGQLHNELRYPNYYEDKESYSTLIISKNDALLCQEKLQKLKLFIKDLD